MGMSQMNGTNRRMSNSVKIQPSDRPYSQHDDLIKYIHDSWSKVESDKSSNRVIYFAENTDNPIVKDFTPFDLEAYWGRRVVSQQSHHS